MKSPFLVVQDFLSPQLCENIVNAVHVATPNVDKHGHPVKFERHNMFFEQEIASRFHDLVPEIEDRYNCTYRGLEQPVFQHYPENSKAQHAEAPGCENAKYVRRKWVQHRDVDLVGFVWLKDFNDNVPLDNRYEVYGGKLEFPAYNFSLVPQRGTLVLFPAGPHFITVISPILISDLYQIKLAACVNANPSGRWFYQPENFPGKYTDWLKEYM